MSISYFLIEPRPEPYLFTSYQKNLQHFFGTFIFKLRLRSKFSACVTLQFDWLYMHASTASKNLTHRSNFFWRSAFNFLQLIRLVERGCGLQLIRSSDGVFCQDLDYHHKL